MDSKFQIEIGCTPNIGAVSAQGGAKAEGSVTVVTSSEPSLGISTPQTIGTGDAKVTPEQGAVVGAVSTQPGVPATGHVTISADRLPKQPSSSSTSPAVPERRGVPRVVWILLAVVAVVAVLVLATR